MSRPKQRTGLGAAGRVGLFVLGLALVFAVSLGVGSLVEPAEIEGEGGHGAEHAGAAGGAAHGGDYSLRLERDSLARNQRQQLRFAIVDGDGGEAVTEFDRLHERRMHLIVVRRDGTGFQHLHPRIDASGTWTVPIALGEAGTYRAFADFSSGGEQHTLAADLTVPGRFEARPFPAPTAHDSTAGYGVDLEGEEVVAGKPASLSFSVHKGGEEVVDLVPYLGARGHLVALREGDLAYLHVHPQEGGHGHGVDSAAGGHAHPNEIAFATSFPTRGRYRLYLQFRHAGAVRTAGFTVEVPR
jgi:hypothetical protein